MINTKKCLEFNTILDRLSSLAVSETAKDELLALTPYLGESQCKAKLRETTDAKTIIESFGTPPLATMKDLSMMLSLCEKGFMLDAEQLTSVAQFIQTCRRMKQYLKKAVDLNLALATYGGSLYELDEVYEEIDRSIRSGMVDSAASPALRNVRRQIENTNAAIKEKLDSILRSKKECFADAYVAVRNGRYVLPVKKEYKNQFQGTVVDVSGSQETYFMEPAQVRKLTEALELLKIEEENEILRILYTLTSLVSGHTKELRISMDCMAALDVAFAKAKLSLQMKAMPVPVTANRKIAIKQGRHPLLKPESCVPLDFEIGGDVDGIIITGPNTGGKTVALKTVGLLSLMAQSGLHVPVAEGSTFCMHANILSDIGDGQNITENLSTFSAHMTNIIEIVQTVTHESLVLLDELGTGTDPAEGMGLAIAILEELRLRGCLFVATTHYPEIKTYAHNTPRIQNARMTFDRESLQPLYALQIGEAGESCALYIAQRLGLPAHMLRRAHAEAYGEKQNVNKEIPNIQFTDTPRHTVSPTDQIKKKIIEKKPPLRSETFNRGDSVMVYPQKAIGVIYQRANAKGELGVQIKDKKQLISHKRVKLLVPASELYPDDYDFSIVFDSVANRKANHRMSKHHDPSLVIVHEEGKDTGKQ